MRNIGLPESLVCIESASQESVLYNTRELIMLNPEDCMLRTATASAVDFIWTPHVPNLAPRSFSGTVGLNVMLVEAGTEIWTILYPLSSSSSSLS